MNINELRVGSFIINNGEFIEVESIYDGEINLKVNGNCEVESSIDVLSCSPINIDEGMLMKLGFKKREINSKLVQYEDEYSNSHEFDEKGVFQYHIADRYWIACQSIHLLQNIYTVLYKKNITNLCMIK